MTTTTTNRPGWQAGTIHNASSEGSYDTIVPRLQANGRVRLDLGTNRANGFEAEYQVVRKLKSLSFAPAGAEVVLAVLPAQLWPGEGIAYVRDCCRHLGTVTVECSDPETVREWVLALRGEEAR